ncbi:hypothetical protein [Streptomyces sp. NPDC051183]|uniref:hypothetical protein n=1 Tax=Streptomyces sp. NPDC051183 TaxID=3155165 RepID=UPI00342F9ED8
MPATRAVARMLRSVTEFRISIAMVAFGAPTAVVGAVLRPVPGAGAPPLYIGLSCLITGLAMLGSGAGRH